MGDGRGSIGHVCVCYLAACLTMLFSADSCLFVGSCGVKTANWRLQGRDELQLRGFIVQVHDHVDVVRILPRQVRGDERTSTQSARIGTLFYVQDFES